MGGLNLRLYMWSVRMKAAEKCKNAPRWCILLLRGQAGSPGGRYQTRNRAHCWVWSPIIWGICGGRLCPRGLSVGRWRAC